MTFSELLSELIELFKQQRTLVLGAIAAIALVLMVMDLVVGVNVSSGVTSVASLVAQYFFIERVMASYLNVQIEPRRIGAMIVSGFLGGLGIIFGFLFFIIPGFILMAAWSVSSVFVVVDKRNGIEALGDSWRATDGSRLAIILVSLVAYIALSAFASIFAAVLWRVGPDSFLFSSVFLNIIAGMYSVLAWMIAICVYRSLGAGQDDLDGVFA